MFTLEQIKEIAKKLQLFGIKNSQFKKVENISGEEEFSVLQDNENKNLKLLDFVDYIKDVIGGTIEPDNCTLTVSAFPENAIVKINDIKRNSIIVKKGTTVKVEVEAVGYVKYSSLVEVTTNKDLIVVLEKDVVEEKGTLTVIATPEDAVVKINGVVRESITATLGTSVLVSVTKKGYKTYTNNIVITQKEQVLNVVLEEEVVINEFIFTINPTPLDAVVKINGKTIDTIIVTSGTTVNWEVSREGYKTKTGSTVVTSDISLDVELEEIIVPHEKVTLTIIPTPSDSVVKINGSVRRTITVDKGTSVTWEVAKEGYITQSGEEVLTEDITLSISLVEVVIEKVQFTIVPTPSDAKVTINNTEVKSIIINKGESVTWEVSKDGYTTQKGTEVVNDNVIKEITLVLIPSKWTDFTVGASPTTENPIESVPYIGGRFSLQAFVTENSKIVDVTESVIWKITGEGCTNVEGNIFEWSENSITELRRVTITASITDPLSNKLEAQVESIQEAKPSSENYLIVTPLNLTFSDTDETKTISITANVDWTIS